MTAQSFFAKVEAEASTLEKEVVSGVKSAVAYIDNVFVTDVEPLLSTFLDATLSLIERNGGTLLLEAAKAIVAGIEAGTSLDVIASQVLTSAKSAGATTLSSEETLAAQTAAQIALAAKAAATAAGNPAPGTASA